MISKTFAVIEGTKVVNVILADSLEDAEFATGCICVEYTDANPAGIGWAYDSDTGTFIAPVITTPDVIEEPTTI